MDENITNIELNDTEPNTDDAFKQVVEEQMNKIRSQSMLIGAQTVCNVILQKIYTHQAKTIKMTYRDYERLIKEIHDFCKTGISRKVNVDGTTSPIEDNINTEVNE